MCRGGVGHNPFNVMSITSFSRKNLVYASTWIKMNIFLYFLFKVILQEYVINFATSKMMKAQKY